MPDPRVKRQVYDRAKGRCEYCRAPALYAPDPFSVEHILPRAAGGGTELSNLALSCQGCNNFKPTATAALDPATGTASLLFHPREDRWEAHFTWSEDFSSVIGLTAKGRATVTRLRLNRPGLVNLRKVLHAAGEHPPVDAG